MGRLADQKMLTSCVGMDTQRVDEPIVNDFLATLTTNTALAYRTGLRDLSRHAARPLLGLTDTDLLAWLDNITGRVGPSTVRAYCTGIRSFYRWAARRRYLAESPAEHLDPPRAPRRLPRPVADEHTARALTDAPPDVAACIALERLAGLRACEVAGLDWSEVQLGDGAFLRVVAGKGRHERVVDIAPELEEILRRLPGPWVGPVIKRRDGRRGHVQPWRVSQLVSEHLDEGTGHQLRHAFGTALQLATGDPRKTAEVLGHAGLAQVMLYTKVSRAEVRPGVLAAAKLRVS